MAGDAHYASVSLLLHGDGANGSTTFTDSSLTPKTVTRYGDAQISTAQSQFGGASMKFDGAGDYIEVGAISDFKYLHDDSSDYTVEGWAYWAGGGACILGTDATGSLVGFYFGVSATTGYLVAEIYRGAVGNSLGAISTVGLTLNSWTYFRFTYTKTTRNYTFRIGSSAAGSGTMTVTGTWPASSTSAPSYVLAVGRYQHPTPGGYFTGYLDDIRFTTVARSETVAPTAAFPNYSGEVAGTILDDTGSPCARTVRIVNRSTGALIASTTSNAGTGAYLLAAPTLDEVHRIVLDDSGGALYNDIIDRVIPA